MVVSSLDRSEAGDALVDRVRKLLDKAARTDNVHEAEAFAEKAAALVAEHRISIEQIDESRRGERRPDDPLDVDEYVIGRGSYVRARFALLDGIGVANDVKVVYQTGPQGMVAFAAGHRSDLDVVAMTFASLDQQAATQMAAIRRRTGSATQRYRRAFLFGFADRIREILAESRRAVEESVAAAEAPGVAVALRERTERVEEHVTETWGRIRSARPPEPVNAQGWSSGAAAADRADVGRRRVGERGRLGDGAA